MPKFRNKLNTLLSVSGCDFIFDPQEVKEFPENSPYLRFLRLCPDVEEIVEEVAVVKEGEKVEEKVEAENIEEEKTGIVCEVCGYVAKNLVGFRAHQRIAHKIQKDGKAKKKK